MKDLSDFILAIIAIIGVFGNVYAFLTARIELIGQRKETERLTRLTSELDHRVHLLATTVNLRIQRFERVGGLVNELLEISLAMRQRQRDQIERADFFVRRDIIKPELLALVKVIHDDKLATLAQELMKLLNEGALTDAWFHEQFDMGEFVKIIKSQQNYTRDIHQRILELIEDTTQSYELSKV